MGVSTAVSVGLSLVIVGNASRDNPTNYFVVSVEMLVYCSFMHLHPLQGANGLVPAWRPNPHS